MYPTSRHGTALESANARSLLARECGRELCIVVLWNAGALADDMPLARTRAGDPEEIGQAALPDSEALCTEG
eukprot:CAMPEP_0197398856 /NCGR_PEP_ID=MMETSP1165-20131217/14134_1 /TAXON_ID=284809 /ORGANISM="Chrysocystis fragilis, Strain CCMP3189" /LENGTH=71 /DNA_ID=CAMNT_0042924825 /DNA_START=211 /DNA_END=423 /DNA_ORIENTATION=+